MAILRNKKIFYTLYTLGAFLFFLWFLFPSDYFAGYLETQIKKYGNGMEVTIKDAKPSLPLSLSLKGVVCQIPGAPPVKVDAFKISGLLSLLGGSPDLSFTMAGFGGTVSGHVLIPENNTEKTSVDGIDVSGVNLAKFNDILNVYYPGYAIKGTLDAKGHYTPEGRGTGELTFKVTDLSIEPDKPIYSLVKNLNFSEISADLEIKSKKIEVRKCDVEGKEVDGNISGSIFVREPINRSTLRLSGTLKPEKDFMETLGPVEAMIGGNMNQDGEIPFRLSGVVSDPRFTPKR